MKLYEEHEITLPACAGYSVIVQWTLIEKSSNHNHFNRQRIFEQILLSKISEKVHCLSITSLLVSTLNDYNRGLLVKDGLHLVEMVYGISSFWQPKFRVEHKPIKKN